ncbi:hypothetical protein [Flavobacterium sp. C4GT6]|uniref:hypothetical protein n=1 Tax=Flavobacterium sp. C4GT6 TaxID=3103818 RepID=UPI002ED2932D
MNNRYLGFLIVIILFLCGCEKKKETIESEVPVTAVSDTVTLAADANIDQQDRYEPQQKSIDDEGAVFLGDVTFKVLSEFTDNVSFEQTVEGSGRNVKLFYREKVIHLINTKLQDTITFRKEDFKDKLPDYDNMILQSVLIDFEIIDKSIPLVVTFCMPDSDYCYFFDVHFINGALQAEMINLEIDG